VETGDRSDQESTGRRTPLSRGRYILLSGPGREWDAPGSRNVARATADAYLPHSAFGETQRHDDH
jgi:hypothetical protein